jgi:hypothetical protein
MHFVLLPAWQAWPALSARLVHLVQVVLNWYNLVAALAAGGVPISVGNATIVVSEHVYM